MAWYWHPYSDPRSSQPKVFFGVLIFDLKSPFYYLEVSVLYHLEYSIKIDIDDCSGVQPIAIFFQWVTPKAFATQKNPLNLRQPCPTKSAPDPVKVGTMIDFSCGEYRVIYKRSPLRSFSCNDACQLILFFSSHTSEEQFNIVRTVARYVRWNRLPQSQTFLLFLHFSFGTSTILRAPCFQLPWPLPS